MRIQLYLVMILALLLQLQTGMRPTKRMIELLHFYAQGLVSETELVNGLKARAREADLARESSRKRYLARFPTAIAVMKCMDGRINLPVSTGTPPGIIQPFRNLGGFF